jgi:acyl-CoA hydrolase
VLPARIAKGRIATVAVNQFVFKQPVSIGDLLSFYAKVERVGRTSVTVHVEVYAERNPADLHVVKVTEANCTYVAIDRHGRPRPGAAATRTSAPRVGDPEPKGVGTPRRYPPSTPPGASARLATGSAGCRAGPRPRECSGGMRGGTPRPRRAHHVAGRGRREVGAEHEHVAVRLRPRGSGGRVARAASGIHVEVDCQRGSRTARDGA